MNYLEFHLVFMTPPLILLVVAAGAGWIQWPRRGRDVAGLVLLAVIALMYTIPWEVMLIREGVWSYGVGVVTGRLWGIPYSEIAFIVLQTLLTGLFAHHLLASNDGASDGERGAWWMGAAAGLAVTIVGVWLLLVGGRYTYLAGIVVWAGPVFGIQWAFGWRILWKNRTSVAVGIVVPTLYLWLVDRAAIGIGLWLFSEVHITGWGILGLPIEEALFFLVTNAFVVQGLALWRWAVSRTGLGRRSIQLICSRMRTLRTLMFASGRNRPRSCSRSGCGAAGWRSREHSSRRRWMSERHWRGGWG